MPRDAVSRSANVERNGWHKWGNMARNMNPFLRVQKYFCCRNNAAGQFRTGHSGPEAHRQILPKNLVFPRSGFVCASGLHIPHYKPSELRIRNIYKLIFDLF